MAFTRFYVRRSSASTDEKMGLPEGSSVSELLDMMDFNPDKNIVLRNDEELELSEIIEDGDHLVIMPRKLSSGC